MTMSKGDETSSISIEVCQSLPSKDALNRILAEYYALIVQRMRDMGFDIPAAAPETALAEFWAQSNEYLPPNGCLVIARAADGDIVGCGMMKRFDDETGELKRVYVTKSARGTGTGRALIEARERVAREMGLKRLVADTLTPNIEMRTLYPKLGFVELETPIETTTYKDQSMLREQMHFFEKRL